MATTLMVNDEYFGERCVGTREQFRTVLQGAFAEWHRDYDGELTFEEYVEESLDKHLSPADDDDIKNCPNLGNPPAGTVRQARKSAGLTQEQAARVIGATRRAWQEWEAGRRNMPGAKWELFQIKTKGDGNMYKCELINDGVVIERFFRNGKSEQDVKESLEMFWWPNGEWVISREEKED